MRPERDPTPSAMAAQPSGGSPTTPTPRFQESLSQLAARILDQLSVSAWLPAATLVSLLVVAGSLRDADGNFHDALATITSMNAASLILLTGAVILTTTLTQAFEFEAIRLLEGYWGPGLVWRIPGGLGCRWHSWRRTRFVGQLSDLERTAFGLALARMTDAGIPESQRDVVAFEWGFRESHAASQDDVDQARHLDWRRFANPGDARRLEALRLRSAEYPRVLPILPTRLGNTLRSYEERTLPAIGGRSLEGFVQREFHRLPEPNQIEHDQFRQRLDLYCSLVVVFSVIGVVAAVLLWHVGERFALSALVLALILSWLSYRAAVASARAYGLVLETIVDLLATGPD
jgi:hypothetical protein